MKAGELTPQRAEMRWLLQERGTHDAAASFPSPTAGTCVTPLQGSQGMDGSFFCSCTSAISSSALAVTGDAGASLLGPSLGQPFSIT